LIALRDFGALLLPSQTQEGGHPDRRYNSAMPDSEIIFSVQESPEGGYEARALGCSIFTQAETMDELRANVKEAVACHFGDRTPLPVLRLVARPKSFVLGSAKGEFTVPDDFNDPDPEIEDLFYNGPLLPK
jgi:hypothetical protein